MLIIKKTVWDCCLCDWIRRASRSGLYRKLSRQNCGACLSARSGVTQTVDLLNANRNRKRSDNGAYNFKRSVE